MHSRHQLAAHEEADTRAAGVAGPGERLTETVESIRRHTAAIVGYRQPHDVLGCVRNHLDRDAAGAAVDDGVLKQIANDGIEAAGVGDDAGIAIDLNVELRPVLRQARDDLADLDPFRKQSAVGLCHEQRILELNLQADGVMQQPVERLPRWRLRPVLPHAFGLELHAGERGLQVVREGQEERLERLAADMLASNRKDDGQAAGDEERDERRALPEKHVLQPRRLGGQSDRQPPRRQRHRADKPHGRNEVMQPAVRGGLHAFAASRAAATRTSVACASVPSSCASEMKPTS